MRMEGFVKLTSALLVVLAAFGTRGLEAQLRSESPRNAGYTIEVRLDPESRMLEGRQVLTWRNIQEVATDELWFHLYWNGWRNNLSTWMREDDYRGRSDLGDGIRQEDWGWTEVDGVTLLDHEDWGRVDLSRAVRFAAPDDANRNDRTVMVVELPGPVLPGEEIRVELKWRSKIPRTFARTGFRGEFFFIAHWFPKLGVFEAEGWNCHQYHAGTEYFSDYGNYSVEIRLPERFVVGATGQLAAQVEHDDGTVTHRYEQRDVHAFTWTASPDFVEVLDRFEESGLPPVDLRLLIQPEHLAQAERHLHATKAALKNFGIWFGPYPYGHVTVVDPAWGSGAGGMEYPTLFTAGTRLFNPFGGGSPEGVTVHEAGHQFWYGLVGNNEFEDAWLDEGLNTFSTNRTMFHTYGVREYVRRFFKPPGGETRAFFPLLLTGFNYGPSPHGNRLGSYRRLAEIDRQDTPSYLYFPSAGGALSYSKTALWLGTLENLLGWDRLQPAMARFFQDWQFAHPDPEDLFATLEESTGEELGWFFDQVFHSSERFDYAVDAVSSTPAAVDGFIEGDEGDLVYQADDESEDELFRTEVILRRQGGGVFPVEILLIYDDGHETRVQWDGQSRWKQLIEVRPAKLVSAAIDPDHVLLLDLDRTNNSRLVEPDSKAAVLKWTSRWMIWLQDFVGMLSFFG